MATSVAMMLSMVAMSGWIMPAPLAMPVSFDLVPVDGDGARDELGARVGGHNGARGVVPAVGLQLGDHLRRAARDFVHRQLDADDARAHDEDRVIVCAQCFLDGFGHQPRVGVALDAGAGIGACRC